jgi:hypothetical protein
MPGKRKMTANRAATELAKIAVAHLSKFSEEEQEARLAGAERLVAKVCRVDTVRKPSSSVRTPRSRAAVRVR